MTILNHENILQNDVLFEIQTLKSSHENDHADTSGPYQFFFKYSKFEVLSNSESYEWLIKI